jgi:hypothetical protein
MQARAMHMVERDAMPGLSEPVRFELITRGVRHVDGRGGAARRSRINFDWNGLAQLAP